MTAARDRQTALVRLIVIADRRPKVRPHPSMECVLWTTDASSNATATSVSAGQSCVEPPAGIEPATPSLPWNHQEPLCGSSFLQVTFDRTGQSYGFCID